MSDRLEDPPPELHGRIRRSRAPRGAAANAGSLPGLLASVSLAALVGLVLFASARPLDTNDFWWHAKLGWAFSTQGLRLEADPFVHTARPGPLPNSSWLFDVAVYQLQRGIGFMGLRVVHLLLVAGALALAFSALRRSAASLAPACLATGVFAILGWYRFIQLRPDLVSIPATLLLYRLVLAPRAPPGWSRVAAAVLLLVVWANLHPLYGVGLCLLLAALLGCGLEALLARWPRGSATGAVDPARAARARRIAVTLGLAAVATGINPEGFDLHLTFFQASREAAIFGIGDDWARFAPFDPHSEVHAVSALVCLSADLVLGLFAVAAGAAGLRHLRRRDAESLRRLDPVALALGMAASVAMFAAVRFLWLSFFPLLYLLRFQRRSRVGGTIPGRRADWLLATACSALVLAFPAGARRSLATLVPPVADYLVMPYRTDKFYTEAIDFLFQARLKGRLFNNYTMGGFIDFWLGPEIQTFIDGRMNVPDDVFVDLASIEARRGGLPGETFLETLDRRGVDIFLGVGMPLPHVREDRRDPRYTTAHLEGVPGWIPVFRSLRAGVYLRANPRNRENLRRVAEFYERQGVRFDPERGLDVAKAVRDHPEWAVRQQIVWQQFPARLRASEDPDTEAGREALEFVAITWALLGAHAEQVRIDRELAARNPDSKAPLRRLVFGLLRLDRPEEAQAAALALSTLDPEDAVSQEYLKLVRRYLMLRALPAQQRQDPGAVVDVLPLPTAWVP